VYIQDITVC